MKAVCRVDDVRFRLDWLSFFRGLAPRVGILRKSRDAHACEAKCEEGPLESLATTSRQTAMTISLRSHPMESGTIGDRSNISAPECGPSSESANCETSATFLPDLMAQRQNARARSHVLRYWLGKPPVSRLKTCEKWLGLEYPIANPTRMMLRSVSCRSFCARAIR